MERVRAEWGADDLWAQFKQILSPLGGLRKEDHLRREAQRNPDRATRYIRAGDQPQDRQDDRPRHTSDITRARGRGDRVRGRAPNIAVNTARAAELPARRAAPSA